MPNFNYSSRAVSQTVVPCVVPCECAAANIFDDIRRRERDLNAVCARNFMVAPHFKGVARNLGVDSCVTISDINVLNRANAGLCCD